MVEDFKRTSPEEALLKANEKKIGELKIFIGYAPGVGKTYSMLNEGNRNFKRGHDIIIGYIESHQRKETEGQISSLDIIPRKQIIYNGIKLDEMDTDAIIARNPETVLVDELAHTNVLGSKHKKRYEDVEEILAAGINVVTTLNIQHLESLNDDIKHITGIAVRETIPDRIVQNADEVVVVDITPSALQSRLRRGEVYKPQNVEAALKNFFRKGNLNALREITLRQTAQEVNEELEEYMEQHGIKDNWKTVERVMVCVTPTPNANRLIRRGARIAKRYKCEWFVVTVDSTRISAKVLYERSPERESAVLDTSFRLAERLGAEVIILKGKSVSSELVKFAFKRHITQIIIGHSERSTIQKLFRGSTITKLLRETKDIEVHIIPHSI